MAGIRRGLNGWPPGIGTGETWRAFRRHMGTSGKESREDQDAGYGE